MISFTYEYEGGNIAITSKSGKVFKYEITISGDSMRFGNQEEGYYDLIRKE